MEKKKARVDLSIYPSFGTPEGTRTPNIQNRNLTLYPLNYGRISERFAIIAGFSAVVKGEFSEVIKFFVGLQYMLDRRIKKDGG